jgi:outer membrane translocation and assembly module TamA
MAELPDVPENLVIGADTPETPESTTSTPAPAAGTPETPGSVPSATVPPSTPSPSNPAIPAAEPKFEIKVDGKVELLTKAEVIALAQQGKSFTQKSQRLADDQRRWEADRQAILQQEREAAIKEWQAKIEREKTEAAKDPGTRAIERVQTLEQKLEDQALDAVLKPLVAKYDLDEQMFCIEATKHGLRTAEDVAARGEAIAKALSEHQNSRFESRFKETLSKGRSSGA